MWLPLKDVGEGQETTVTFGVWPKVKLYTLPEQAMQGFIQYF